MYKHSLDLIFYLLGGAAENELRLKVEGTPGWWVLPVQDASVNGARMPSPYKAKEALFSAWYGRKKGMRELAKDGWES